MNIYPSSHRIKSAPPRPDAAPALAAYVAALSAYQRQRTETGRAVLFKTYQHWIQAFLDDEGEAERAAKNFVVALRNQPSQPPEMDAAA